MNQGVLLDTHALVWWWTDSPHLPRQARTAIADPGAKVFVSAASAWEIATKHRIGKWPGVARIVDEFATLVARSRFVSLDISSDHALSAGALESHHRDPFDRMLVAQARLESMPIITGDPVFRSMGADVIWSG